MNLREYKEQYGVVPYFIDEKILKSLDFDGRVTIKEGMILFDEESSGSLAPSFIGGFSYFRVTDYREWKKLKLLTEDRNTEFEKRKRNKEYLIALYPNGVPRNLRPDWWDYESLFSYNTPCEETPFSIYICGADDAEYVIFFSNEEDAIEHIDLMLACQPLNFNKDISMKLWQT